MLDYDVVLVYHLFLVEDLQLTQNPLFRPRQVDNAVITKEKRKAKIKKQKRWEPIEKGK